MDYCKLLNGDDWLVVFDDRDYPGTDPAPQTTPQTTPRIYCYNDGADVVVELDWEVQLKVKKPTCRKFCLASPSSIGMIGDYVQEIFPSD